jgi:hypothetical protein
MHPYAKSKLEVVMQAIYEARLRMLEEGKNPLTQKRIQIIDDVLHGKAEILRDLNEVNARKTKDANGCVSIMSPLSLNILNNIKQ